ncbi:competence pheromone ComX [Paenibacillus monticola]|uniref:ComX pheromone n=1 Tax=Paenibacillus monticola TaxID=2666075 RepID=A0A7X2H5Q4_9BACL|nr:competence pheromone ComX [Paenibacillus monticola]MRN54032.1 hypothetical protein [Paenibacillus monticola]
MLKELIQNLMKDPGMYARLQSNQLQLAGISEVEQRALVDVIGSRSDKNEVMKSMFWAKF